MKYDELPDTLKPLADEELLRVAKMASVKLPSDDDRSEEEVLDSMLPAIIEIIKNYSTYEYLYGQWYRVTTQAGRKMYNPLNLTLN